VSRIWIVIGVVLFLFKLSGVAAQALSKPWTGSSEQLLLAFVAVAVLAVLTTVGFVVNKHGWSELRRRFGNAPQMIDAARAEAARRNNTFVFAIFWIIVLVLLVAFFYNVQPR
jgi:hypothetical protein